MPAAAWPPALGMKCGDELVEPAGPRSVVAVIGDGAFSSGIVLEAMNHAGGLKKNLVVILNDNKMSICPRVGGLAESLDRLRMNTLYTGLKTEVQKLLGHLPVLGDPVERFLNQVKGAIKAGLVGGMFFEELGFRYVGPVDGHNIRQLKKYLAMVRQVQGPVLLHVVTEKGHGFPPAAEDPTTFHTPEPFARRNGSAVALKKKRAPSYTLVAREAVLQQMRGDARVAVITAAMCQGTMLEPVREEFPQRFFDVGICESHAVAFAAGLAKAGMRPLVAIYSTFMQRAYDQIFQEVALQNLPVTLLLDRAGLVGPDGPTHHGVFDLTYLRPLPNLVVMAPGDQQDLARMIAWSVGYHGPTAIRYPKAPAETVPRPLAAIEPGMRRSPPLGRRRHAGRLRHGAEVVCPGGRPPGQGGAGSRRDQRPLRQTAGLPDHPPRRAGMSAGGHGRGGGLDGRVRQRGPGSGRRGRPGCQPRPSPGHPRPVHRTRRPRGTAGRPGTWTPAASRGLAASGSAAQGQCQSRRRLASLPENRHGPRRQVYARIDRHEPALHPRAPAPAERPLRVVLLSAAERPDVVAEARRLRTQIEPYAQIVATDFHAAEDLAALDADVAVVLGGDGSILRAVHQMGGRQLPVIAVNLGKLGFLADVSPDELPAVLRDFRAGKLTIIEHLMFDCRVIERRRGACPEDRPERDRRPQRPAVLRDGSRSLR